VISGSVTGWLFEVYSLADVFYKPVAPRIIGYDLSINQSLHPYATDLLSTDFVKTWRQEALKIQYDPEPNALPLSRRPWPI